MFQFRWGSYILFFKVLHVALVLASLSPCLGPPEAASTWCCRAWVSEKMQRPPAHQRRIAMGYDGSSKLSTTKVSRTNWMGIAIRSWIRWKLFLYVPTLKIGSYFWLGLPGCDRCRIVKKLFWQQLFVCLLAFFGVDF